MDKGINFMFDYEKIVGERKNLDEYYGPEKQATELKLCTILEPTEIEYSNRVNFNK